jgi:23S rRNA (cytidine1920-2'-O)/16S rRNA (cytidine1409-2'-O)-methyltransferase
MKQRLDKLLLARNLAPTSQKAQAMIAAGLVFVAGKCADKAGMAYPSDSEIAIKGNTCPYVSRGGLKLEAALDHFKINPQGFICADIGASTGGFTDCLLQRGATKVYAIDVGYGQLDWKLRQDERVVVMERTNARHLKKEDISDPLDLAVVDASFISLKLLLPPLLQFFKERASIITLIKPQFEVGKGKVGEGGVVRDAAQHDEVINNTVEFARSLQLQTDDIIQSPVLGPKGNKEFLAHFISSRID